MLVLTRKTDQKIHIGCGITITILRVHGGMVRMGIEAPSDVKILRGELTPTSESNRQSPANGKPSAQDASGSASGVSHPSEDAGETAASGSDDTEAGGKSPSGGELLLRLSRHRRPAPGCGAVPPGFQDQKSDRPERLAARSSL